MNSNRLGSAEDAIKLSQLIEHGKVSQAYEGVSVIDVSHIRNRVSSFYAYVVQALNGKTAPTSSNPDLYVTDESKITGELELDTTIAGKDVSTSRNNTSSLTRIIRSVRLNMSSLFPSISAVEKEPAVKEADFTHSITSRGRESIFQVQNPVIAAAADGLASNAAAADGLADDWVELFHKKYQRVYWKNTVTGEKTWKKPLKSVDPEDLRSNLVKINSDRAAGSVGAGVSSNLKNEGSSANSAFLDRVVQMSK